MHQKEILHDDSQAKNVKTSNLHLVDVAWTAHEYFLGCDNGECSYVRTYTTE